MASVWKNLRKLFLLLVLVSFSLPVRGAQAQSDKDFVKYRQKLMRAEVASMRTIGNILKKKLPYQKQIVTHAKIMELNASLFADAFKKEITDGKTDAKQEIWKDWAKFVAAAQVLAQESATVAEVAQSGDAVAIGAQMKKVGMSCGGCHKRFRKPKKESYKQKKK